MDLSHGPRDKSCVYITTNKGKEMQVLIRKHNVYLLKRVRIIKFKQLLLKIEELFKPPRIIKQIEPRKYEEIHRHEHLLKQIL